MTARREPPALCAGMVHLFFSDEPDDIDRAKLVCRRCARAGSCLDGALERRESFGVWGGELIRSGQVLAQTPRRGRPRSVA